jgi:hypothetical protein
MADNQRLAGVLRGWSDVLRGILLMCAGTSLFLYLASRAASLIMNSR